jgi:hypothetical protein
MHDTVRSFAVPDVSDGLWHFVCTSWHAGPGIARVSVDGKASCSGADAPAPTDRVAAAAQDAASFTYVLLQHRMHAPM